MSNPANPHPAGPGDAPGAGPPPTAPTASTRQRRSPTFWVKLATAIILATAGTLLIVQNDHSTDLRWLTIDLTAPLWLLLLTSAAAGAVLARLAPPLWRHRKRRISRVQSPTR